MNVNRKDVPRKSVRRNGTESDALGIPGQDVSDSASNTSLYRGERTPARRSELRRAPYAKRSFMPKRSIDPLGR